MSLDLRTGKPVWAIDQPKIAEHKKMSKDLRTGVVVIGGGISGALLAHRLAKLEGGAYRKARDRDGKYNGEHGHFILRGRCKFVRTD